jgi:hypothetical protein
MSHVFVPSSTEAKNNRALHLHEHILNGMMFNQLIPGVIFPLLWDMVYNSTSFIRMDRQWTHCACFLRRHIPNVSELWKVYIRDGFELRILESNGHVQRWRYRCHATLPTWSRTGRRSWNIQTVQVEIAGLVISKRGFVNVVMDSCWIMKMLERVEVILVDRW